MDMHTNEHRKPNKIPAIPLVFLIFVRKTRFCHKEYQWQIVLREIFQAKETEQQYDCYGGATKP